MLKLVVYSVKFNEFANFIKDSTLDIIAVTETWLKFKVPDGAVDIPGYVFCRDNRLRDVVG